MKTLTREQVASRKDKAVRFLRDVRGDRRRAARVEAQSVDDYALRRGIAFVDNPKSSRRTGMPKSQKERLRELKEENRELREQVDELHDTLDKIADIVVPEEEEEEEPEEEDEDDQGDED